MIRRNAATSKAHKASDPAYDWAVALDQYPDLNADVAQCRDALPPGFDMSLLPVRTHTGKDFVQYDAALPGIQALAPSMAFDLAERGRAVLQSGIDWLRLRYDGIWSKPPIPQWSIDPLIQRAIGSSSWVTAYESTKSIYAGARTLYLTYAEIRTKAEDHQPAWSELDESRLMPPHETSDFTTLTLYISRGADKDDAVEAVARAWPHVEEVIGRPFGKRQPKPGKRAGGRLPNYSEYVALYQAWNNWRKEHGPYNDRGFCDAVLNNKMTIPHWKDAPPKSEAGFAWQLAKACRMLEPHLFVPARLKDYIEQKETIDAIILESALKSE